MEEKKVSVFLSHLLKASVSIVDVTSEIYTAEKFLVTVITSITKMGESADAELLEAAKIISKYNIDLEKTKEILLDYITNCKYEFVDGMYMDAIFGGAMRKDCEEVNVATLVKLILENPSDIIFNCLRAAAIESDEGQAEVNEKIKEDSERSEESLEDIHVAVEGGENAQTQSVAGMKKVEEIRNCLRRMPEASPAAKSSKNECEGDSGADDTPPADNDIVKCGSYDHINREKIEKLIEGVKTLHDKLSENIFGQEHAIEVFTTGLFQAELLAMTDKSRRKPGATFLFAGPPGVGKTFLAETVATLLGRPFMRFDMSGYSDKESAMEFCGSDSVYKNSKGGNFTTFVKENPVSVVLFDEIEKAHISIIHLFLQILDAGRIRDSNTDEEIALNNVILIFTTNAGKQLYESAPGGDFSNTSRRVILKALENDVNPLTNTPFFPSTICSRFASGNVVMFNYMGAHNLYNIVRRELRRHASNYEDEFGVKINIDDTVAAAILFAEGGSADARTVRSRAESFFDNELFELFRMISSDACYGKVSDVDSIDVRIELPESGAVRELFEANEKPGVLTFASDKVIDDCRERLGDEGFYGSGDVQEADSIIKNNDIGIVVIDMSYGVFDGSDYLNVEDTVSLARNFFHYVRETYADIPVYLVETDDFTLEKEEKRSLIAQGVRGILSLRGEKSGFADKINAICCNIHQQMSMKRLASENKVVTFETAQKVSPDGKSAEILLFDFALKVTVEAEDSGEVINNVSRPDVTFDEIIGAEEAKAELKYFIDYLKNPKKFLGTGVKAPKGVLLYGPPGTGKTMLAKAMASESGVTFITAEGDQFLKKYVGEGSKAVHEIFSTARKYAPAILFIDEIDAIAKCRTGSSDGLSSAAGNTLTALLAEMDGFKNDTTKPVFVLAETNFDVDPDSPTGIDEALVRRFDRSIYVDLPNRGDRIRFMNYKRTTSLVYELSDNIIESLAVRSTGMSLADLDSVFEMALRSAIRSGEGKVTDEIMEECFEVFTGGEKKVWDISQLERVARHESGHALLCWLNGEKPSYLTIVARGDHGGYMMHGDMESKFLFTKDELLANIRTSLGGRAAEIVYYGKNDGLSTGASGDLASATRTAQAIICRFGMDASFGLATIDWEVASGELADEIRSSVNVILNEQMKIAVESVKRNKKAIDIMVETLMMKNHLVESEIDAIFKKYTNIAE